VELNKSQKRILFIGLLAIVTALLMWIGFGGEIFTKTQVIVEKQNELFGTTYKEWKDQFILGLDYTLAFIVLAVMLTLMTIYFKRDKGIKSNLVEIRQGRTSSETPLFLSYFLLFKF